MTQANQKILLTTHINPDGDALGSMTALYAVLKNVYKCDVTMAATGELADSYNYLPYFFKIEDGFDPLDFDRVVILDCGSWTRTGFFDTDELLIDWPKQLVVIDHHPISTLSPGFHHIQPQASSTCELVYELTLGLAVPLTYEVATSLLAGLVFDTGAFKHANTDADAYAIAAKLTAAGADIHRIVKPMFIDKSVAQLKLWGRALKKMQYDEGRKICLTYLDQKDFDECRATPKDAEGLVNLMNSVPDISFCLLLLDVGEKGIKGSLRTERDNVDVAQLAKLLGGGGHHKASGFTLPARLVSELNSYKVA